MFFVIADFFRRRRPQRRYARDELPMEPVVSVLTLWMLVFFGGMFAAMAIAAVIAAAVFDVDLERLEIGVAMVLGALSPVCLWLAVRVWRKLTR